MWFFIRGFVTTFTITWVLLFYLFLLFVKIIKVYIKILYLFFTNYTYMKNLSLI